MAVPSASRGAENVPAVLGKAGQSYLRLLSTSRARSRPDAQATDVLHLPRLITACIDELEQLLNDFPSLTVVLAHLGLPHLPVPGLHEAYGRAARFPNVFMDTAMIPSVEVISAAMSAFGPTRILFGSDEPVNLIRASVYRHPTLGERLATSIGCEWADPAEQQTYGHLASDATHLHWQAITAVHAAIGQLPTTQQPTTKIAIFHDTAARAYGFD